MAWRGHEDLGRRIQERIIIVEHRQVQEWVLHGK
jgi:hypothetical protein